MAEKRKNLPKKESIKKRTIQYMKELGTYKTQYGQVIEIFADLIYQYNYLSREFERSNYQVMVDTEKSGGKKSPIFASLESLRKDIGAYSDRLKLNAKAYDDDAGKQEEKEESPFAAFLKKNKK